MLIVRTGSAMELRLTALSTAALISPPSSCLAYFSSHDFENAPTAMSTPLLTASMTEKYLTLIDQTLKMRMKPLGLSLYVAVAIMVANASRLSKRGNGMQTTLTGQKAPGYPVIPSPPPPPYYLQMPVVPAVTRDLFNRVVERGYVGALAGGDLTDCHYTAYGCCSDDVTPATGPEQQGCDVVEAIHKRQRVLRGGLDTENGGGGARRAAPLPRPDCHVTRFGCCMDGVTIARGFLHEGCIEHFWQGTQRVCAHPNTRS